MAIPSFLHCSHPPPTSSFTSSHQRWAFHAFTTSAADSCIPRDITTSAVQKKHYIHRVSARGQAHCTKRSRIFNFRLAPLGPTLGACQRLYIALDPLFRTLVSELHNSIISQSLKYSRRAKPKMSPQIPLSPSNKVHIAVVAWKLGSKIRDGAFLLALPVWRL